MNRIVLGLAVLGASMAAAAANAPLANLQSINLQSIMVAKVNPQGLAFWDITNNTLNDEGQVDPKKLKPADWTRLLAIGKALQGAGRTLATSNGIIAAAPGAKLQDQGEEGSATPADVQRYLDAKPAIFRSRAQALQKTGADIIQAAMQHDAKALTDLSGGLDKVCEQCHITFWYPNQKIPK